MVAPAYSFPAFEVFRSHELKIVPSTIARIINLPTFHKALEGRYAVYSLVDILAARTRIRPRAAHELAFFESRV